MFVLNDTCAQVYGDSSSKKGPCLKVTFNTIWISYSLNILAIIQKPCVVIILKQSHQYPIMLLMKFFYCFSQGAMQIFHQTSDED